MAIDVVGKDLGIKMSRASVSISGLLFLGAAGYLYNINGVFYTRQVGLIMLPKSQSMDVTNTLNLLFAFEAFMHNLGQEAQAALERRECLDNICEVADVQHESIPSMDHPIYITPTRHNQLPPICSYVIFNKRDKMKIL